PPDSAEIYFQTNPGPGWSKGDNLEDPRKLPTGPGAAKVPFGPLPREWAKYKGLYLHGDDVVFTYTVGEASLFEKPGIEKTGGATLLTRTFNVLSSGAASTLVIADGPSGSAAVIEGDNVAVAVVPNNTANT